MQKQFDNLYGITPKSTDNPKAKQKQLFIEQEQARILSELPTRPSNISFFEEILLKRDTAKADKPLVGYFCNMVPAEIIHAMGAVPVRLDGGNNIAAITGEEILSGEICPVAKASFGIFLQEDSLASSCDLLIIPTSCDAKRKMGEVLNDFKPTFMLNLPPEQNHRMYIKQVYAEMKRLVEFLRQNLKVKLSKSALKKAIDLGRAKSSLVRRLQELRSQDPRALSIRDLFLIVQASAFGIVSPERWIEETTKVLDELKNAEPPKKSLRPRLVLTGAPIIWPNFKVLNLLEECGADIVADTVCTGAQSHFDPVVVEEKSMQSLLRALAGRYVFASICPCFISQNTRINRILELYESLSAGGVVNYSLRRCQRFDGENYRIGQVMRERNIPFFNVRTDYSLEDTEQLRVRIEAFLETL